MLKLPKGLKKKKKGKKSKKDQELFTEAELEQYRREHQKQKAEESSDANQHSADEREEPSGSSAHSAAAAYHHHSEGAAASSSSSHSAPVAAAAEDADEWRRFNALATGVDSILKKTQGDLDRIKSTSFFTRVPPPSEVQKKEDAIRAKQEEEQRAKEEAERLAEEAKKADKLASAVIELSDSEEEESVHDNDDIFDTTYIDVVKDLPLAYVPESPTKTEEEGPDPFDTSYADTVITKVSKRGKALVNIGSAVEVLTGRVEANVGKKPSARRPRRGPLDLLLVQSFDDENAEEWLEKVVEPVTTEKNLLDSPAELLDAPIDLTKSLHFSLAKEKKAEHNEEETDETTGEKKEHEKKSPESDDGDEQALLAFFGAQPSAPRKEVAASTQAPKKSGLDEIIGEGEYDIQEDDGIDPFDTQFVAKLLPASLNEDPDFDPRAENPDLTPVKELFSPDFPKEEFVVRTDLLEGGLDDSENCPPPVVSLHRERPRKKEVEPEDIDPFDTSAVNEIVAPGRTELKFLEKELERSGPPPRPPPLPKEIVNRLKPSLSDDDFDPRAGEEFPTHESLEERKSSLVLQIHPQHKVTFAIPSPDLLAVDHEGRIQKPLTPYYEKPLHGTSESPEDPFDTSFVGTIAPSEVELNQLAKDLLPVQGAAGAQLSDDDDFDPRAVTPQPKAADWLAPEEHNTKVLTPAVEAKPVEESSYLHDPFDTSSVEVKLQPGQAELKLIESELLPEIQKESAPVLDILSDSHDDSLPVKALTPVVHLSFEDNEEGEEIDPFDTTFASNIAPGRAEIKLLESELIDQ